MIIEFVGSVSLPVATDRALDELYVGMPVEMSFRRLASKDGFHNYGWKSIPVRG